MPKELIFITGAAGFLGANVVREALKAGYRVRGGVRKESQVKQLSSYFGPEYGPKAEFVTVPDITKPDAYEGLLQGVSYVFHVASPLTPPSTNWKEDHIDPAVNGTLTILKAAEESSSIKKCVITGSIADLIPWGDWPSPEEAITVGEDHGYDLDVSPDLDFRNSFAAYRASKLLAAKAAREYFAQQKPHYHIDMAGSRGMLWASLKSDDQRIPIFNHVHVTDVAQAHIKVLDPSIVGYQKFILSAEPGFPNWDEVLQFVKHKYPDEQWGTAPSQRKRNIDVSKAEKVLGMSWIDWQRQVMDTVEPQLALIKNAHLTL